MENELDHINIDLSHLNEESESDKQFILARLEGLLEHVNGFEENSWPIPLKQRVEALKLGIIFAFSRL